MEIDKVKQTTTTPSTQSHDRGRDGINLNSLHNVQNKLVSISDEPVQIDQEIKYTPATNTNFQHS